MKPKEFAEAAGVGYALYLKFEWGESPLSRRHDKVWKPTAQRIADFHGLSPDELWPEAVCKVKQARVAEQAEIAAATMGEPAPLPEEVVRRQKLSMAVTDALERLPPRERMILERRFGVRCPEETLKRIGDRVGLSCERIRSLQERALARLWHSSSPLSETLKLELAERRARALQSSRPTPPTPTYAPLAPCHRPSPYDRYMELARKLIILRRLRQHQAEYQLLAHLDAAWRAMLPDDRERVLQNNPFEEQQHGRQRNRISVSRVQ